MTDSPTPTQAPEPAADGPPASIVLAAPDPEQTIRQLNLIRLVAIADFVLLVPLLMNLVGIIHSDAMVSVIGPIHGIGFLLMAFLCLKGVGEQRWGWWFPIITVVTLGPPGSLYGEHRIRRELKDAGKA